MCMSQAGLNLISPFPTSLLSARFQFRQPKRHSLVSLCIDVSVDEIFPGTASYQQKCGRKRSGILEKENISMLLLVNQMKIH